MRIKDLINEEEKSLKGNELISINFSEENFNLLMSIYEKALLQVYDTLVQLKDTMAKKYGYEIINNVSKRIKEPESIVGKLKRKHYKVNFKNIIDNINDVAGIRVICPVKSDIYTTIDIISELPNIKIIETKDYISKPKKSGYSGYHLIIETPIEVEGQKVPVKVEIQIRTMAMDFWATNEHKLRYKTDNKLSFIDSKKLTAYAKLINMLDDKMMEIYSKSK